jgi:8-oxo-dGTP pyrophosphatase MutT (NUDIX family)
MIPVLSRNKFALGVLTGIALTVLFSYVVRQYADARRFDSYFAMLDKYPHVLGPLGNAANGEIEIIRDVKKIREIEQATGQKVGVIAKNRFSTCIYDPVKFPNGSYGIHGRFFGTPAFEGTPGAAVLPIMPDGKVLLVCIYRHPLRRWVLEIPRGARDGSETVLSLIKRELKEETGAETGKAIPLGSINPDSGMTVGNIPIVKVNISSLGSAHRDEGSESSMCLHSFSMEELQEAIRKGFAPVKINGRIQEVQVADSFLLSALLLDQLKASAKE